LAVHLSSHSRGLGEVVRLERHALAAKVRLVRAVLGWSQTELGRRVGLTQRAIHKLEQGETEPRRTTVRALEAIWREQSLEFEDLADGGFRVSIRSTVFEPAPIAQSRRTKS
jgi:DNA-binding XRE family transcriptional regulator